MDASGSFVYSYMVSGLAITILVVLSLVKIQFTDAQIVKKKLEGNLISVAADIYFY